MTPLDGLRQAWHWSVRKTLKRWVRVIVKPEDAAAEIAARPRPVCYVLERESRTDLAVLSNVCRALHLPRPERRLAVGERRALEAHFDLIRPAGVFKRNAARALRILVQLVAAAAAHPEF